MPEKEPQKPMERGECCVCPQCQFRFPHIRSERCRDRTCPNCGVAMVLEKSSDHLWLKDIRG